MIVAVDAQLTLGTATGIGEYVRGLIGALRAIGVDARALCEPRLDPWRFDRRAIWDQVVLPRAARAVNAGVLHCASGTMPLHANMPVVATVHDVAWLRVQAHARPYARWYFGPFSLKRYHRAAAIAVDSAFSRDELIAVSGLPPERVHVVYPGVASDVAGIERRPAGDGTIFVPGTVERRKNLQVLIRALPQLPRARIVSAGPFTPYRVECERLASELGVADRVTLLGYVAREELLRLYATCAMVAVPSRYEGFGYAAAQALCAGTPLIVSDQSSLPEVAGGAAPVVPVDDPGAWAGAIEAVLAGPDDAQTTAASARPGAIARFSWESAARAMNRMYQHATGGRSSDV